MSNTSTVVRSESYVRKPGKTAKDKANNAQARNANNKTRRAAWQQEGTNSKTTFPLDTCNGKKSQSLKARKN